MNFEATLAKHAARLDSVEKEAAELKGDQSKLRDKLDTLRNLLIAVLGGIVAQLVATLVKH